MSGTSRCRGRGGFALVLTLTLLALLMLALVALSTLVNVNGQVARATAAQSRARQNALLGLSMGRSELQKHAGHNGQITGMAGIAGIAPHAMSTTRNWCGVWRNDGSFVVWLVSGSQMNASAMLDLALAPVTLVGNGLNGGAGSVGASSANSEHVIAGKISIVVTEIAATPGAGATIGSYAFLVSDEGAKISAFSPPALLIVPGVMPLLTSTTVSSAQERLRTALDANAGRLPDILSYEQLSLLPTPSSALAQAVLQDNFHHVTLTAGTLDGGQLYSGTLNLNTASPYVWRSVLETYNSITGVTTMSAGDLTSRGSAIAGAFASSASGKNENAPFTSIAAFGASALLASNLPATITPEEFMTAMSGVLRVRSDTFRIRAYGEALDPLDGTTIQAVAYCEAIVQRTLEVAPNAMGQKFVVTYFRWLGPDDI